MATVTSSFSFSTLTQSSSPRNLSTLSSNSPTFRFRVGFSCLNVGVRASNSASKIVVRCSSAVAGLFGSPLSVGDKRVQLYTCFQLFSALWEMGSFQFLFFFLRFGVKKIDILIVDVWLSNFYVCFWNLVLQLDFWVRICFMGIMLQLEVWLMRFDLNLVLQFLL